MPTPAPTTSSTPRRAAVLGGNRIPFARQFGPYAEASNQDMLTAAIDGLIARHGLAGQRVGEVVAGAVIKHSRDFNLARESVLGSALAPTTPAYDVQQACGTGLQAAFLVANKIALGQIESITAHHGEVLQLRPKAANGQALTPAIGRQGELIQTRPRGFYLRTRFTRRLLQKVFSPH